MAPAPRTLRIAGWSAILAGVAWIAWAVLNARSHGGLDYGEQMVGPKLARVGQLLMVAWNLLLLPAALVLWRWLSPQHPDRMTLVTLCGLLSLAFWAYGGATHGITPSLEVSYLTLSAIWWIGVGQSLRPTHRGLGLLTLALGVFAAWDAVLTALEPVPFGLYLTAAPKLPLSILWDLVLGVSLLVAAGRSATPTHSSEPLPMIM